MSVRNLAHMNIGAPAELLLELRDFYCKALGLVDGLRPPFKSDGYWLYADGVPIVHLFATAQSDIRLLNVRTTMDHIAFGCTDFYVMRAKLDELKIKYLTRDVPVLGQLQLFMSDPAGNCIELLFEGQS